MRWGGIFDVDAKRIEVSNKEEKTLDPNFWNDSKADEQYMRELRSVKQWVPDSAKAAQFVEELELHHEYPKAGEVDEA